MKYSRWIGILAALVLIGSCFMPWTYYPDLKEQFTGFFSHDNNYGRPGKFILFFAVLSIVFFLIPRIWAKRINVFIGALVVAFCIKSFILFTGCYRGICPEKLAGIWVMLGSALLLLMATLTPSVKRSSNS